MAFDLQPLWDWFRVLHETSGIKLTIFYDAFDRARFFNGFLTSVRLMAVCLVASVLIGVVGAWIMVADARLPLREGETPLRKRVRFRTLGCYPLTGAIDSDADTLEKVIAEMLVATTSERQGRVIDQDPSASMEKKKQEGYF